MKDHYIARSLSLFIAALCVAVSTGAAEEIRSPTTTFIQDQQVQPTACHRCGKANCNCCCEPVCCPKRITETEKKHCWCVNKEFVCIPFFRLPWECCKCPSDCSCKDCCEGGADCASGGGKGTCGPLCGWVRCVNVLEKKEYECDKCGYEWDVKFVRRSGSGYGPCGNRGCNCPKCGHGQPCASEESEMQDIRLTTSEQVELR